MNIIDSSTAPDSTEPRRIVVYGETGMRKTTSLKTLPDPALPAILLDFDRKSFPIREHFKPGDMTIVQFDLVEQQNRREIPITYTQAKKFVAAIPKDYPNAQSLIVDSATLLHMAVSDYVRLKANKGEEDPFSQPDYGIALNLFLKFQMGCIATGLNLIYICHEKAYESELTGTTKGVPALTGQLGTVVPRFFQEILHATTRRNGTSLEYGWETVPAKQFIASSTVSKRGEFIPADFSIFWQKGT